MAKFVNPTKVITGKNTRFSYLVVNEPKAINGGTPKYSVSLIIGQMKQGQYTRKFISQGKHTDIIGMTFPCLSNVKFAGRI